MKLRALCPDSFASNCYLLVEGTEALAVDPGISLSAIRSALSAEGATLSGILLTHGHFDHILSLDSLREAYPGVPVYIHRGDADYLTDGQKNAFATFFGEERVWRPADHPLTDGEIILLGEERVRVLHTPGHTPGSVCYQTSQGLLTGDTLFAEGYGRCDLPGGSMTALVASLRLLGTLSPETPIYPGHGGSSTVGDAMQVLGL